MLSSHCAAGLTRAVFRNYLDDRACHLRAAPRPIALILRMPYLDCMLHGVGMLSSQRINLTTLSMSVRQTTHAPTAVELPLLLPDVGVRVCFACHILLPLATH